MTTKPAFYHRDVISAAFDFLEKYDAEMHKYAAEQPRINGLQKEEVYSDLILPRMPRFINNCRIDLTVIQQIISTDLSAAKEHFEYNCAALEAKLDEKLSPSERELVLQQLVQLARRDKLVVSEKKLLAYMRSCIRRTKIAYLQHKTRTAGREINVPCEVLDHVPKKQTPLNGQLANEADEFLQIANIKKLDRTLLIDILIHKLTFAEAAVKHNVSRQTAARRYQEAIQQAGGNSKLQAHYLKNIIGVEI